MITKTFESGQTENPSRSWNERVPRTAGPSQPYLLLSVRAAAQRRVGEPCSRQQPTRTKHDPSSYQHSGIFSPAER